MRTRKMTSIIVRTIFLVLLTVITTTVDGSGSTATFGSNDAFVCSAFQQHTTPNSVLSRRRPSPSSHGKTATPATTSILQMKNHRRRTFKHVLVHRCRLYNNENINGGGITFGDSCNNNSAEDGYDNDDDNGDNKTIIKRRKFLSTSLSSISAALIFSGDDDDLLRSSVRPVHASGLIQFPIVASDGGGDDPPTLKNIYHLMRSGRTLLEEQDIYCSNPLLLTNRDAALSSTGRQQVLETATKLQQLGVQPSQIRHSLAASAMDTAQIIKDTLKVGQNRINPEFVFMDPRSVGLWEGLSDTVVKDTLLAYDSLEATSDGTGARPPPNDDGTPNETLFDQKTRLVQLFSGLETQYSGDNILLVFPDPTGPALLQALMAGVPLNEVHLLDFEPAEIRLNVTPESTLELFEKRRRNADSTKGNNFLKTYEARLQHGQQELDRLLSLDATTLVSKKDEMILKEQQAIEDQLMRKKQEQQAKQELLDEQLRQERQHQIEESAAAKRIEKQQKQQAQEQRTQQRRRMSKLTTKITTTNNMNDKNDGTDQLNLKTATIATSLAFSGAVAVFAGVTPSSPPTTATSTLDSKDDNDPKLGETSFSSTTNETAATTPENNPNVPTNDEAEQLDTAIFPSRKIIGSTVRDNTGNATSGSKSPLYSSSPSSASAVARPPTVEEKKEAAEVAMKDYLDRDDGGDEWLHLMEEILLEDDDQSDVEKELRP